MLEALCVLHVPLDTVQRHNLVGFGVRVRLRHNDVFLFVLLRLPDRRVQILGRYKYTQEQVENLLFSWIDDDVVDVALDARPDFTEAQSLLLAHLGMVRYRSAVLYTDAVSHFVVHLDQLVEEFRLHLNHGLFKDAKGTQLMQHDQISVDFLREVCPIQRVDAVGADDAALYAYLLLA